MENKINLEEIIKDCVGISLGAKNTIPMDYGECKFILKYFAEKLLNLAAENAKIYTDTMCSPYSEDWVKYIDKQSILDTIKQVE